MIPTIVAAISFVTIIVTTTVIVAKGADIKKQYDDRLRVMSDQINNAQYYNSEIDKKNISDISDVRKTYTSKDELSRSVDTRDLSARRATASDLQAGSVTGEYMRFKMSTSDNLRTDKLLAPGGVVGQLDASLVNSSRINLMGGEAGKGAVSFSSTAQGASGGEYLLQRGTDENANNLVMKVPGGSSFDITDGNPEEGIRMKPTEGEMKFSKWTFGKARNKDADDMGVKYDMLGVNFDNSLIAGFYKIDGKPMTHVKENVFIEGEEDSTITMYPKKGEPMFIQTGEQGKGMFSWGKKPLEIWAQGGVRSGGVSINMGETDVNGVKFASQPKTPANIINDKERKMLMLYGDEYDSGRTVGIRDNVAVFGNAVSKDWTSGQNAQGRDNVVAGDWAAWMRKDGMVQGKNLNSDEWNTGKNVGGRDHVVAGDWAAWMRNDGLVQARMVNATGWTAGQNVMGRDNVVAGNWNAWMRNDGLVQGINVNSEEWAAARNVMGRDNVTAGNWAAWMRSDGQTFAKNAIVNDTLNVGNVQITGADGTITAKNIVTGKLTPQNGLLINDGPMQLGEASTMGAASSAGPNKRFFLTTDGKLGINTDAPAATLHVNGDALANSIGRKGGDSDWFRINAQNGNVAANPGIAAYNGMSINDGGGLSVGSWKKVPPGVIQATTKVVSPALTRAAGDNNWLLINSDNPAAPMAVYGPAAFARGLAVGAFDGTLPTGTLLATAKVVTPAITKKAGEAGPLNVNADNQNAMLNVYSPASFAKGMYVGAANNSTVPAGSIQASGNVAASSFSRKGGTNDWLKIDNANGPGVALVGSGVVTKGLSVGVADSAVPLGTVKATSGLCINSTCLTETDLTKLKSLSGTTSTTATASYTPTNCSTAATKYLQMNPDVASLKLNPWFHWTNYGQKEGRVWPPC